MPGKFVNTIVFVSDLNRSKTFYTDVLGIRIREDLKTIVFLENNLVLHCANTILKTVFKGNETDKPDTLGMNNLLIYFECDSLHELEKLYSSIKDKVRMIHEIELQEWGQKVFRFYDPDGHIVEFGEPQK